MPQTYIEYTGDGVTTDFLYDKPYIKEADVYGFVNGTGVSISFIDPTHVQFAIAPPEDAFIKILRSSDATSARHTYDDPIWIPDQFLEENIEHKLFLIQELQDVCIFCTPAAESATTAASYVAGAETSATEALASVTEAEASTQIAIDQAEIISDLLAPTYTTISEFGDPLNWGSEGVISIARMTESRIGGVGSSSDKVRAFDFNPNTGLWVKAGNDGSPYQISTPSVSRLTPTSIVHIDANNYRRLQTQTFDGTNWTKTGDFLSLGTPTSYSIQFSMCSLDSTSVAMVLEETANLPDYELQLATYAGGIWGFSGAPLALGQPLDVKLCTLSPTDILLIRSDTQTLQVYRYNGSSWSAIGNATPAPFVLSNSSDITALTSSDVLMTSGLEMMVIHFDGTDWTQTSVTHTVTLTNTISQVVALTPTLIAAIDGIHDNIQAYKLGYELSSPP